MSNRRSTRTPTNTDPLLLELLRSHYTLPQVAARLGVAYSYAYRLVVQEKRIPSLSVSFGRVRGAPPKYLVPRKEVQAFKRRERARARGAVPSGAGKGRPRGRPRRPSWSPRARARPVKNRYLKELLSMGRALVAYRKEFGHYPEDPNWTK